jgi:hypothetical protein
MKTHMIAALAVTAFTTHAFALTRSDRIGEPAAVASADRTVSVAPDTRHVDVQQGETVNLDVNGGYVAWHFDGVDPIVNLDEIVPGAPNVDVYVAPPPDK